LPVLLRQSVQASGDHVQRSFVVQDRARINMGEDSEVHYWSERQDALSNIQQIDGGNTNVCGKATGWIHINRGLA